MNSRAAAFHASRPISPAAAYFASWVRLPMRERASHARRKVRVKRSLECAANYRDRPCLRQRAMVNAKFAFKLSNRAYILGKGHVRFSGSIATLQGNAEVRQQYLGL